MASCHPPLDSFLTQINNIRNEINSTFTKITKNANELHINLLKELQSIELEFRRKTEANVKYNKTLALEWEPATEQALQGIFCKIKLTEFQPPRTRTQKKGSQRVSFQSADNVSTACSSNAVDRLIGMYRNIHRPDKYSSSRGKHSYQLDAPRGLSIDSNSRRIYVADTNNDRIQIFKFNAKCVDEITHKELISPKGICVSEVENRVFVTLSEHDFVQAYRKDGSFVSQVCCYSSTKFDNPVGLAADMTGKLYVCDRRNDKVVVLDKNLNFVTVLTKHINRPRDVKIRGSQVVILQEGTCCISFYTRGGEFLKYIIETGQHSYQVETPYFFDIDSFGNIFITDTGSDCVKIFNCQGSYLCDIGYKGEGKGEMEYPTGIGLIPENDGIVVVSDRSHYQLQIFNP